MRHYFSTKVKLVLALALVLAVLLGVLGSLTGGKNPGGFFQTLLTPLRSGAYALTGQVERLYDYVYRYDSLVAENEALKQELDRAQSTNEWLRRELDIALARYEAVELIFGGNCCGGCN